MILIQRTRTASGLLLALFLTLLTAPRQAPAEGVRLDLNAATKQQLEDLPHIGPAFASAIVEMRARNGGFRCVEELRALPRLPEKHYKVLAPLLQVAGGRQDCPALEKRRRQGRSLSAPDSSRSAR